TSDPNPADNTATFDTSINTSADIQVTKADSPDPVVAGNILTYTITLVNAGPSDAQDVTLTDTLPANTTFVSFTAPAGWSSTTPAVGGTGTITSTNATVADAPVPQVFTLVVAVNAATPVGTTLTNTATGFAGTSDPNTANNTATQTTSVIAQADLSVTKTDSPDPVIAGTNLTYTITVTN